MKKIFFWVTGGRPMLKISDYFRDQVTERQVCYFRDHKGTVWLAEHPWSLFRIKT